MIPYDLLKIKAFAFDVDGVLSSSLVMLGGEGGPMRTANIKDGYALQLAVKRGFSLAVITGGNSKAVEERYRALGVQNIYMGSSIKKIVFSKWLQQESLDASEVIYVGDDIPDLEVMKMCGCPCCPSDACEEIKENSVYVSPIAGGMGCVRDIVEQVLRVQSKWISDNKAFGW